MPKPPKIRAISSSGNDEHTAHHTEDARKRMNDANTRIRGSLESIRRAVRVLDEESAGIAADDLKFMNL